MNRAEKRIYYKSLDKESRKRVDKIIQYHKLYEGKDNAKLEKLIFEEIKDLSLEELTILYPYLESQIGDANS